MNNNYIKYTDIVKHINICSDDIILLSSNLMKTIFYAKKYEKEFNYNKFIDSFLEVIGTNGTLTQQNDNIIAQKREKQQIRPSEA